MVAVLAGLVGLAPMVTAAPASAAATSAYAQAVLAGGPSAYYRLDEAPGATSAADSSGKTGPGTYHGGVTLGVPGALRTDSDPAAGFDGKTGYVSIPPPVSSGAASVSVEAWFKTTGSGVIVGAQDCAVGCSPSSYQPVLWVGTDGHLRGSLAQNGDYTATSAAAVNDGGWHQAVLSAGSSNTTLYLDGQVAASVSKGPSLGGLTSWQIGVSGETTSGLWPGLTSAWPFFSGSIDEVAAFPSALTQSQVDDQWSAAGEPPPGSLTPGYWMVTTRGAVLAYGGVSLYGSAAASSIPAPIVAVASTPDGGGYWMAGSDGSVYAYGDAHNYGSMRGVHLTAPVVGITATPDGKGYLMAASDGGIFAFGDAVFHGSMGGVRLNKPVVGLASDPATGGYWEVATDGGIFSFDAPFFGSTGAIRLNQPIVGMAAMPKGGGYRFVASDGGIFDFGDAVFYGSTGAIKLNRPIAGMADSADGRGYWLVADDGGIFTFGDAPFRGSAGATSLPDPVRAMAYGPGTGSGVTIDPAAGLEPYPSGSTGYDISWPQCPQPYPGSPYTVAVVGVNDGHAFSTNPCLSSEAGWAGPDLTVYINLNSPNGASASAGLSGPAGNCASSDTVCQSYNYGWASAVQSMDALASSRLSSGTWWLDVETGNYWSGDTTANAAVIGGAIAALAGQGMTVGIYSTSYQWGVIAGSYQPKVPVWYPTGTSTNNPAAWCTSTYGFSGGPVWMVQTGAGNYDGDYAC
ncbi:MAG TPA: LamG-like jellyroll fold domain-containing protein [Acidimicrobiales bacterium]|nr:LamG-like jellyroll fold domain-containing protein [Acidimicrobiales bacterium]